MNADNGFRSACVASIVRVTSFSQAKFDDMTYTIVPASYWTTVEQSLGIICGCLVTLRKYFVSWFSDPKDINAKPHAISYIKTGQTPISLADMKYRQANAISDNESRAAFAKLDEESGQSIKYMGTASMAAKAQKQDLPVVPDRIIRRQEVEQHFDAV